MVNNAVVNTHKKVSVASRLEYRCNPGFSLYFIFCHTPNAMPLVVYCFDTILSQNVMSQ